MGVSIFNTGYDLQDQIDAAESAIAIVSIGSTHAAITSGQYVYVREHGTLADGLYRATANIAANGTLSGSNVTAVSGGGLNALNSKTIVKDGTTYAYGVYATSTTSHTEKDMIEAVIDAIDTKGNYTIIDVINYEYGRRNITGYLYPNKDYGMVTCKESNGQLYTIKINNSIRTFDSFVLNSNINTELGNYSKRYKLGEFSNDGQAHSINYDGSIGAYSLIVIVTENTAFRYVGILSHTNQHFLDNIVASQITVSITKIGWSDGTLNITMSSVYATGSQVKVYAYKLV